VHAAQLLRVGKRVSPMPTFDFSKRLWTTLSRHGRRRRLSVRAQAGRVEAAQDALAWRGVASPIATRRFLSRGLPSMRVFISHSTQDRWVASRISDDLRRRGIETFLDAKDIETGDTVARSIQSSLADCDELLLLLSPAAIQSPWVLLEVGGAKALDKRVVPILHHVGPNDIPAPISTELARDINDIARYYDELERRRSGTQGSTQTATVDDSPAPAGSLRPTRAYSVNDVVKLPEQPQPTLHTSDGLLISWSNEMTAYAGKLATVNTVRNPEVVSLDIDGGKWWWAMAWLEPGSYPEAS
jgi:hypothetical protein